MQSATAKQLGVHAWWSASARIIADVALTADIPVKEYGPLLPIMTTPITSRSTTMIATLFSTSHSRSLSNGRRIRAGATRWATAGTPRSMWRSS